MADLEAQKKLVLPYLQRAEEVQAVDLKVAYYCRLWAVDQALKITNRHKEIDGLLRALLIQLEKDKPRVAPLDPEGDKYHCESFASNIFRRANRVDRAGRANIDTARAFWASSVFYDVSAAPSRAPAQRASEHGMDARAGVVFLC
ncbi:vacuolar protein sorting-associated protein VTA1 [Monoraphidium neglectum]|uniref:Vacuolar protein sorting-associated protein VTA1 n=1 Tax=Monoraphidium neglectum TaxID=145388 RepID=A0A0D2LN63_9CHLO|nr:vacuolar protein sorting-associated protein VTA1 [Monoraphidium neglectum]KIY93234.1 vacuolar protein sorting-associated protein VTA1 [Monoraphidium neglectum]|eukprot:XP_013892254.1 vacuolar protein sorting-associated protein VTA1 [Monoraphidium neglectum]